MNVVNVIEERNACMKNISKTSKEKTSDILYYLIRVTIILSEIGRAHV